MALLNDSNSIVNGKTKFHFGFDHLGHLEPTNLEGHGLTLNMKGVINEEKKFKIE